MANELQPLSAADGRGIATELEIPSEIRETLNAGVLTAFEARAAFEQLLQQIAGAVQPKDFIEWLWVQDVTSNTWDIRRARRAMSACLTLARKQATRDIMANFEEDGTWVMGREVEDDPYMNRANRYVVGERLVVEDFAEVLERMGLTEQSILDTAYNTEIDRIERLQKLIDNATLRRDGVLKEADRRRDAVAKRLRQAVEVADDIIDAECEG